MGSVTEPHCSRHSGYLLHHQHVFQEAQARTTILNWGWGVEGGGCRGVEKADQVK